ncbi:MAG: glycoside hydrolase family 30 protein, partial [Polyangiaceae bacterium]|nr:glycoside hydrolase family 30 protein [Polyangiaceae bacterium]
AASLDHDRYAAAKAICQEAGISDEALLEACIVDVGMTGDEGLAASTAEIPPPVSAGPSVYELVVNSEIVDADLVSDEEPIADGAIDGVFDVSVRGPFTALVLVTADRYGAPSEGQQWDTLVDDQPIPENMGSSYAVGASTWVLGVEEDGVLLNQPDGTLLPLSADVHTLRLYAADSGYFAQGQRFRLYGVTPDGLAVPGPITDGSDPGGDLGQFCIDDVSCHAGLTCVLDRHTCSAAYGLASDTCCVPSGSVGEEGEPCAAGGTCQDGLACLLDPETCAFGFSRSVDSCCIPSDQRLAVQDHGYFSSGPWHGHAWLNVEVPPLGSTITPSDFEAIVAGDPLCTAGTVAADPDFGTLAVLGLNVNESIDGGEGSVLTWVPDGYAGIRYAIDNPGGAPLRLVIQGAAGFPDESWCAELGTHPGRGFVPWSEFGTSCWDSSGSAYSGEVPLESVMVLVPGWSTEATPYDFCLEDLAPVEAPGESCAGPDGYCWWTHAEASSSAEWIEPLAADTAHVYAAPGQYESAGMGFNLDPGRGTVDLGVYDEFIFDAVVVEGQPFTVSIGNDDAACSWNLTGAGASRYLLDLSSPSACGQTACGYDLRAQWVTFNAPWGVEPGQSADILVSHVEFLTTGDGAVQAVAGDAGTGPGGRCWSAFVYSEVAAAEWVELGATVARVHTTAAGDGQSGMKAELLPDERDLSPYAWLEFDAEITGADSFEFLTVADGSWCSWLLSAAGAATYRVDLAAPDDCSGRDPAAIRALAEVGQLEFKNLGQPELDMSVTDIRFAAVTMAQEHGYVTSGPWAGYAWTTVESPSLGSTITPADFGEAPAGESLCVTGAVAADADWRTYAILGLNINQTEGGAGPALTWSTAGFTGIQYLISNPGQSQLRLQISGAAGHPDETWCADLDPETRLGFVAWNEFRTDCWDDSGSPYVGDVPIQSVMVIVPGDDTDAVPFDFCLEDLAPVAGGGTTEAEPELIISADGAWWQEGTVNRTTGNAAITVNPNTTYQTWIGFGGAFNERGWQALQGLSAADRELALRLLFSRTEGAGFTMGRIPMGASDYALERYSYDDTPDDYAMSEFSIAQDQELLIPYIKAALAISPDLYLWASPWTPPPWMKTNGVYERGWMKDDDQTLAAYALYFSRFIDAYAAEDLPVRAVCPHNEPGWEQGYPSCLWRADTYMSFVGDHLGPRLATDHPEVEIWLGTMSRGASGTSSDNQPIPGDPAIVTAVMNNATARGYIDGIGLQWEMMSQNYSAYQLPLHATEHKGGNYPWNPVGYPPYDSERAPNDLAYGVESWGYIKDWIVTRNGNSYSAWNMVLDPIGQSNDAERSWNQNALLVADGALLVRTPAYYVFRHAAEFVDPGAVRIETSAPDGFAFRNPDGDIVLVMHTTTGGQTSVGIDGTTLSFTAPANGWVTLNYRPGVG